MRPQSKFEGVALQIKGRCRYLIRKKLPDGSIVETWSPWKSNRVVDGAGTLIAGLLKKDTTFTDWGLLQYAIGEGLIAWDAGSPPTPAMTQAVLLNEFDRNAVDYVIYVYPTAMYGITSLVGTFSAGEAVTGDIAGVGTVASASPTALEISETTAFANGENVTGPSGTCQINAVTWSTNDPAPPGTRTYRVETRATFTFADGPSPGKWIREHALFGGDATSTQDSGIIFNVFNDNKIWKDNTIELQLFFQHDVDIVAL